MSEIKLAKCPFCGGEAKTFHIPQNDLKEMAKHPNWQWQHPNMWVVGCDTSMCMGNINHFTMVFVDEQSAIKTWNTRKPMERIIERLEEEKHSTLPTFDEDGYCNDDSWEVVDFDIAIEIVKEVGGIE
jgi:hypothetical protein